MLIYVFDPLCGWCYAMADVMDAVRARRPLPPTRVVCGGLVRGERVGPIATHRPYLERGMAAIEARTATRFGAAFRDGLLAEGTWVADSEPSSRAVLEAARRDPEHAVDFAHALSRAHYRDGLAPDTPDTLRRVAAQVGIDGEALVAGWDSDAARTRTGETFAAARQAGLTTYPTLAWEDEEGLRVLVQGLPDPDTVVAALDQLAPVETA